MTLGLGSYRFLVNERGAGRFTADLTRFVASGEYGRERNSTSLATLNLAWPKGPGGVDCASVMKRIEPWAHELSIVRDSREVWVGPIVRRPVVYGTEGTLDAFDMSAWLDVRFARTTRDYENTGIATSTFITQIVGDAINVDDPGFLYEVRSIPDLTYRTVLATDDEYAWTGVLEPMAGHAFDMTAVGRLVVFWPAQEELGVIRNALSSNDLVGSWPIGRDGQLFATRVAYHGKDDLRSVSGATSARYGLVERRIEDDRINNQSELDLQAARSVTTLPPLTLLGNGIEGFLSCDAPVNMSELVPGMYGRLSTSAAGEIIDRTLRLEMVRVTINSRGDQQEQVGVAFTDPESIWDAE